jgi:hypothetical protein
MNKFPQANDYTTLVEARKLAELKLEISSQLSKIAKQLENFHEKCDPEGFLYVEQHLIGGKIYDENRKVISESGWVVSWAGAKWRFSIRNGNPQKIKMD